MDLDRLVATAKKSVPSSTHTPGAQEDNSEPKAVRTEALLRTSNLFHDIPERVALPARLKSSFIRRCRRNERGLPASPTTAGQLRGCSHPQLVGMRHNPTSCGCRERDYRQRCPSRHRPSSTPLWGPGRTPLIMLTLAFLPYCLHPTCTLRIALCIFLCR